jgi:hypothetical protein
VGSRMSAIAVLRVINIPFQLPISKCTALLLLSRTTLTIYWRLERGDADDDSHNT